MRSQKLSAEQRQNIRDYAKSHKELRALSEKAKLAEARRRAILERIFDEIDKDPSRYTHVIREGSERKSEPMTRALAKNLRRQALRLQAGPNPHGGPGCDDCDDIEDCWCAFSKGPLCCYICLSLAVIQCHF